MPGDGGGGQSVYMEVPGTCSMSCKLTVSIHGHTPQRYNVLFGDVLHVVPMYADYQPTWWTYASIRPKNDLL